MKLNTITHSQVHMTKVEVTDSITDVATRAWLLWSWYWSLSSFHTFRCGLILGVWNVCVVRYLGFHVTVVNCKRVHAASVWQHHTSCRRVDWRHARFHKTRSNWSQSRGKIRL